MISRGKYIVIEGGDGTGKTTLVKAVSASTEWPHRVRRFPSDGVIGHVIREGLMGDRPIENKAFMYLFAADGMQENSAIEGELARGLMVLCDRHPTLSGEVFQLDHHKPSQISQVYGAAVEDGMLKPDVLFVIDIPPEVALERMRAREKYVDAVFEKHTIDRVSDVRRRYLSLADRKNAIVLDGLRSTAELVQDVVRLAHL
ncbi:MAG: dTMP kinase [Deltaproteobacteria bacterium]|nr:dTMP kinase [Deltaproteobacteria bacterium]